MRRSKCVVFLALLSGAATAQTPPETPDRPSAATPTSKPAWVWKDGSWQSSSQPADEPPPTTRPAGSDRRDLEKKFADMLTGVVLRGSWQMVREEGLAGKAPLGEPRTEKYTIAKASKLAGDYWTIWARIQYADKDVNIPVPVRVLWAGDTPIITLDKVGLPGLGTYSARVMIYNGFYSGTWFGDCYGGILSGQIIKEADLPAVEAKEAKDKRAATTHPK